MIADDAILMQPDGPLVQGRDAIVTTITKAYDTKTAQQTATVDEVIVMGDHAYGRGTWTLPRSQRPAPTRSHEWQVVHSLQAQCRWDLVGLTLDVE